MRLDIPKQDDGPTPVERNAEIIRYLLDTRVKNVRIFLAVHGVLTSAALISKILWMSQPQRRDKARIAQAKHRCEALQKALGIAEEMPPKFRQVRNSLEHYDERMDDWLAANDGTVYATGVGSPDSVGMVRTASCEVSIRLR